MWKGAGQSINHSQIYISGQPTMPRFKLIVIAWDTPYMLRKRSPRHSYSHTNFFSASKYGVARKTAKSSYKRFAFTSNTSARAFATSNGIRCLFKLLQVQHLFALQAVWWSETSSICNISDRHRADYL